MRSDQELRKQVEAELEWEPSIDSRQIGVAVVDGIVTLTGTVTTYYEKWKAERATERVDGVRGIANEIEVKVKGTFSDSEIAHAAVESLKWNVLVPASSVKIEVEKGRVTLRGEVKHDYQRRAVERAVRNLPGVRAVSNLIQIEPRVEPRNVKAEIEQALKRQAELDAAGINVDVDGSKVTLRGRVRTWTERHDAEKAAWAAPGVTSVRNELAVEPVAA
jgi:osmotically-inducible protein OsmY